MIALCMIVAAASLSGWAGQTFTDINAGLTAVEECSLAWGDYDDDGDLDLALAGSTGTGFISRIYRNEGGAFTDINAGLVGVHWCSVAWGDYDNDGDLDLALCGRTSNTTATSTVYRNDGGVFTDMKAGFMATGQMAWGDFNNDGQLDLAIAGPNLPGSRHSSKIYRNDHGAFTDIDALLVDAYEASLAWGDYDNDGDLDLAIAGDLQNRSGILIYNNDQGSFREADLGLRLFECNGFAWGDYDGDGDLDLAAWGFRETAFTTVFRNDGTTFTDVDPGLGAISIFPGAWGDYDNDGDLDLLSAAGIWRNDAGKFTDIDAGLGRKAVASIAWGDFDNDGDLDVAFAGWDWRGYQFAKVYRNDGGVFNTPPKAPDGLAASLGGNDVVFSWGSASDAETPAAGLCYSSRVGTAPGRDDVSCSMADNLTGFRRTAAFGGVRKNRSWHLRLPAGMYYWSVQAVDTAFAGSAWSDTQAIAVPISVVAPNGGEHWCIGSSQTIRWQSYGDIPNVCIELHRNGNWEQLDGSVPNTGSYLWTVTGRDEPDCLVRVSDADGTASDHSDGFFAIGRFADINAGLPALTARVAWGDYDNDGALDLAVCGYGAETGHVARVYRNRGEAFEDIAAGLPNIAHVLVWGDYDNDGNLDLVLAGDVEPFTYVTRIYHNRGGRFEDTGAGIAGVEGSLAWGDYDNDGDLDLAIAGTAGLSNDELYGITKVYRNDGGVFVEINTPLPNVEGAVAWVDYDNDGDLDLSIAGFVSADGTRVTRIYRNDNGSFSDIGAHLAGFLSASLAWGDYDNDGDLDLAISGWRDTSGSTGATIYRNDGGGVFTDVKPGLMQLCAELAWGDYDNDGDLDLAFAGRPTQYDYVTTVYRNDGGVFTDTNAGLCVGVSLAWGDYDNDGDLDLAVAGGYQDPALNQFYAFRIYRNEGGVFNSRPTAPGGLAATRPRQDAVTFSWRPATDGETPGNGLCYNLRVGRTPAGADVCAGMADVSSGWRRIPALGNAQKRLSWTIKGLANGSYYWSVQAIDTAFAGSAWAPEQVVQVGLVPGDVNGDGCVNVTDLLTVRNCLGKVGSGLVADVCGNDNVVNVSDLLFVRNQMGRGACQ